LTAATKPEVRKACPALEVRGLTVKYGRHLAIEEIEFVIEPGELVALVGPNGAGKSTLLHAILGAIPWTGQIALHGRTCQGRFGRSRAGFVPQQAEADRHFPINVFQVVASGRRAFLRPGQRLRAQDRQCVTRSLARVGLDGFEDRPMETLSGGQYQRVMIARALAQDADVMLLDEPLANVDRPTGQAILDLLSLLARESCAVLISTHDLPLVRKAFKRCIAINGRLVRDGEPADVLSEGGLEALFSQESSLAVDA
jgi:ABC-type Mn2+/Zn2+ transport system ATPase subunit